MSAILWVLEVIFVGHVVVKYKVTLDQPEDGSPNYEGMMYIEVQAVLGEGEGIVDGFEERVKQADDLVGQIEALEMGRL